MLRTKAIAHGPAVRSAEWVFLVTIAHGPAVRTAEWVFEISSTPRTRRTVCRMEAKVSSELERIFIAQYTFTHLQVIGIPVFDDTDRRLDVLCQSGPCAVAFVRMLQENCDADPCVRDHFACVAPRALSSNAQSASCAARNTKNKPLTKFDVACIPMLDSLMQQCVGIHAAGDIRLANAETNKLEILHSRIHAKLLLKHSKLQCVNAD